MDDPFHLDRFVQAQEAVYEAACAELRGGAKRSHWMWFVFPQIRGLGYSAMSQNYAISSLKEAVAYLEHPVLGPRIRECTRLVLAIEARSAHQIFGAPDDLKFQSSMTLFGRAAPQEKLFGAALEKFFGGASDDKTLEKI